MCRLEPSKPLTPARTGCTLFTDQLSARVDMQASPQHRALSLAAGHSSLASTSDAMRLGRVLDEQRCELVRLAERDAMAGQDLVSDDAQALESEVPHSR